MSSFLDETSPFLAGFSPFHTILDRVSREMRPLGQHLHPPGHRVCLTTRPVDPSYPQRGIND